MVLNEICPPALIYLIFSVTHVSIDTFQGHYNTAFAKIWVALVFTIVLNYLCRRGLGIISWFIVFIPFMLMTLIISILLYVFGLNPSTGRLKIYAPPPTNFNRMLLIIANMRWRRRYHVEKYHKREVHRRHPLLTIIIIISETTEKRMIMQEEVIMSAIQTMEIWFPRQQASPPLHYRRTFLQFLPLLLFPHR